MELPQYLRTEPLPWGGGFCTSGSVADLGSGGVSLNAESGELTSMNGGGFSYLATTLGCILGVLSIRSTTAPC